MILVWIKDVWLESVATESFQAYWREWEFHFLLIVSLSFQFLLMIMGHVRKIKNGGSFPLVSGIVYLTYVLADLVATVSLSTFLRASVTSDNSLVLLWAPFLLWHLGGPSNVTAYSLEDNQIWTRHFIGLLIHVLEALYIFIRFGLHADHALRFMATPILIAGVIKYGERVWALQSASQTKLVDQLFFGGREVIEEIIEDDNIGEMNKYLGQSETGLFRQAYLAFMMFRPLFFGFSVRFCRQHCDKILHTIKHKTTEESFKLVEMELSFLYDSLYTKIPKQIRKWGRFRHTLCLLFAISSLLAFFLVFARRHYYGTADIFLTYLLFLGAILLECFSVAMCLLSTWALVKSNGKMINFQQRLWARLRSILVGKRDISMGQHDLIDQYCFKQSVAHPMRSLTRAFSGVNNTLRILWNSTWVVVDADLKEYIYRHVTDPNVINPRNSQHLLDDNVGGYSMLLEILERYQLEDAMVNYELTGFVGFIFVFHIATSISHYIDIKKYPRGSLGEGFRISKCLSDYMMYLTLVRPLMLPKGMAYVINKETEKQVREVVRSRTLEEAKTEFAKALHSMDLSEIHPAVKFRPFEKKLSNSTVLGAGIFMSKQLHSSLDFYRDIQVKWDTICKVWVEILAYVAFRCAWKEHAQQLKDGGELLTYVALILAHHGHAA